MISSLRTIAITSVLVLVSPTVFAQEPSSDEIVCRLDPHCPFSKPGFRKLEITGATPDDPLTVNLKAAE